jgi:hypothetical protein
MISFDQIINDGVKKITFAANEFSRFVEKNTVIKTKEMTTSIFMGMLATTWFYAVSLCLYYEITVTPLLVSLFCGSGVGIAFLFLAAFAAIANQNFNPKK